MQRV
jgi:hypothetical protein